MTLALLQEKFGVDIVSHMRKFLITEPALIIKNAISTTEVCLQYVSHSFEELKPSTLKSEYYCIYRRCNLTIGEQVKLKKRKLLKRNVSKSIYSDLIYNI